VAVARGSRRSFRLPLARPVRFAYAIIWDAELFGDGAATLDTHAPPRAEDSVEPDPNLGASLERGAGPPHLTLSVVAPSVLLEDGCTPVLLAVSDDGVAFSSSPVCVCFHAAADPTNTLTTHAAACASAAGVILLGHRAGPSHPLHAGAPPRRYSSAAGAVVALVVLGLLGALYLRRRLAGDRAEGTPIFGRMAVRSDSPDSPGEQRGAAPVAAGGAERDVELLRTTAL
jgi:hypothetical protein